MDFLDDPSEMTPEQRREELAAILALGYARNRISHKGLDCPRPPTPSWDPGLTDGEPETPAEVQS